VKRGKPLRRKTALKRGKPLKKRSERGDVIQAIIDIIRGQVRSELDNKCEVCGAQDPRSGLHHLVERSQCPKLIVHRQNLMLLCWYCHIFSLGKTKDHPAYRKVDQKIIELRGEDYREKLLIINKIQPKITLTYLKMYLAALKLGGV